MLNTCEYHFPTFSQLEFFDFSLMLSLDYLRGVNEPDGVALLQNNSGMASMASILVLAG